MGFILLRPEVLLHMVSVTITLFVLRASFPLSICRHHLLHTTSYYPKDSNHYNVLYQLTYYLQLFHIEFHGPP